MAAVVTGHANLCIASQNLARLAHITVALPQMHTIGLQAFCQGDAVINNEGDIMLCANGLQGRSERGRFMLVDALHAKLERRNRSGGQRRFQFFRENRHRHRAARSDIIGKRD